MESGVLNQVLVGDVRQTLPTLPAGLFHCAMTSPPYWNLRSYLKSDDPMKHLEIGSERTPDEFVATMVDVFRHVKRVLRDDGVLWVNLGDGYNANGRFGRSTLSEKQGSNYGSVAAGDVMRCDVSGLRDGDQLLMPHRVAMAMQADGWILRSTIIWAKKSPMPESVHGWRWIEGPDGYKLRRGKWRPTTAHEYVFMFSKSERYFCDGDAIQEPCSPNTHSRGDNRRSKGGTAGVERNNDSFNAACAGEVATRNPRSVWSLSSEPYKGAHFATFPTELAKRCIEAATSSAGCCPTCGMCYAPIVVSERVPTRPGTDSKVIGAMNAESPYMDHTAIGNRDPQRHVAVSRITGYAPSCSCFATAPSQPCSVLDPFGGSGTVGQVARQLGRDYVLCELNNDYLPLIEARIKATPRWAIPQKNARKRKRDSVSLLFDE